MTKKNNAKEVSMKSVRNGAKSVLDLTMTLKAACASINSVWNEQFENEGTTMTVKQWCETMDYKFGAKGITPSALQKVWHEKMRTAEGKLAVWRKTPAKVGDKIVYEYDAKAKDFKSVGEYHICEAVKWTPRMIVMGLIDSWNYAAVENKIARNTKHIAEIKKFYVTESKDATRKHIKTAMMEVSKEQIVF